MPYHYGLHAQYGHIDGRMFLGLTVHRIAGLHQHQEDLNLEQQRLSQGEWKGKNGWQELKRRLRAFWCELRGEGVHVRNEG